MDKEDRILDLKLKIIELKLEKKNEILKTLVSFLVGIISFLYAVNSIENPTANWISSILQILLKLQEPINLIILFLFPFIMAYIMFYVSTKFIDLILKNKKNNYDNAIGEIENLLTELDPKYKSKQKRGKKQV